jgi:hypothetical protein
MAEAAALVVAGPFLDRGELRGMYIFAVDDVATADSLTRTDPAIRAGTLRMELKPWYGSAALMGVNAMHRRLSRQAIVDTTAP